MKPVKNETRMSNDARIAVLETTLLNINSTLLDFKHEMRHSFDKLEQKVDALDHKFEAKIDALDHKFEAKIDVLDHKFENKFDALDKKLDTKFDLLNNRLWINFFLDNDHDCRRGWFDRASTTLI